LTDLQPFHRSDDDKPDDRKDDDRAAAMDPVGSRLLKSRTVIICEEINQRMARRVIAQLLALADESEEPITLFLNSQGGHVEAGDTIHDVIRFIRPRVRMVGTGWVASAGTHIFLAADKADRACLPNTRFLIHQPWGGVGGQATDITIQAEQIEKMRERLARVIAEATGQPLDRVMKDIDRDRWMSPQEAIDYGIAARVIRTAADLG
jgi:ATP-dependent Clp protease protease subunit